jgi:hypothetical protein
MSATRHGTFILVMYLRCLGWVVVLVAVVLVLVLVLVRV